MGGDGALFALSCAVDSFEADGGLRLRFSRLGVGVIDFFTVSSFLSVGLRTGVPKPAGPVSMAISGTTSCMSWLFFRRSSSCEIVLWICSTASASSSLSILKLSRRSRLVMLASRGPLDCEELVFASCALGWTVTKLLLILDNLRPLSSVLLPEGVLPRSGDGEPERWLSNMARKDNTPLELARGPSGAIVNSGSGL